MKKFIVAWITEGGIPKYTLEPVEAENYQILLDSATEYSMTITAIFDTTDETLNPILVYELPQQKERITVENQQVLSFVACPNPNHISKEGWASRQLYYAGNGIFKCSSCGKEFTREEIQNELQKDYASRLQELQLSYELSMENLYKNKHEDLEKFNKLLNE